VVVVIEALREWLSEMIRRQRDTKPAGAEAPAAEAPAAGFEAREDMMEARRKAAEAAEGRMLGRNPRKVRPPWLPLPTTSCASSC
jgi:hypothetical protein